MVAYPDYENMTNKIRCKKCKSVLDGEKSGWQTCECENVSIKGIKGDRTIKFPPGDEPEDWIQYVYRRPKK